MKIFFHPLYTDGIHPEARFPRSRYRRIAETLAADDHPFPIRVDVAPCATVDDLQTAHDDRYVERFLSAQMTESEARRIGLRPWTELIIPRTMRIMGGAISALMAAHETGGYAANLAGGTHHAHYDFGSGYCVFNDLAICARIAQQRLNYKRVAILDLDVHQGDGTATILTNDKCVLTISVHCQANFPFRKAQSDIDLALPVGADDTEYLAAVDEALAELRSYEPELLLYQAGVDGLATDKLGKLAISSGGMAERNKRVFELCDALDIPCAVFMGGGYSDPIEHTVDAFYDLFTGAARAHAARLCRG